MYKTHKNGTVLVFSAALLLIHMPASFADENADTSAMRQEIAELRGQVKDLESQLAEVKAAARETSVQRYEDWDPFAEMDAVEQRMQSLMPYSFRGRPGSMMMNQMRSFNPGYDLKQNDKAYVVTLDMPGMDKAKINVEVKGNVLYISGERSAESKEEQPNRYYRQERSFGYFSRAIPLPHDAKEESLQAKYDNGVLTVTVERTGSALKSQEQVQKIDVK